MEKNLSQLDLAIEQIDSTFSSAAEIRQKLVDKVQKAVEQMYLAPNEDSDKVTIAKLQTITTLQGLLKDMEASTVTNAKVKLQKKESESSAAAGQMVIELLKSINLKAASAPAGETTIPSDLDASIDHAIRESNHDIGQEELEANASE